jgi:hypothetical protein
MSALAAPAVSGNARHKVVWPDRVCIHTCTSSKGVTTKWSEGFTLSVWRLEHSVIALFELGTTSRLLFRPALSSLSQPIHIPNDRIRRWYLLSP